jgi:hypothetical protein
VICLGRRTLLAAPLLLAGAGGEKAADWMAPLRREAAALGGPGLIRSYTVRTGADATDFDRVHANCAYVYDNAVAGMALLAAGEAGLAGRIGSALVHAQVHDRFFHDGRLRNAYAAGPMDPRAGTPVALPGWWDAGKGAWLEDGYQTGSAAGVVAWAMLLWLALAARTGEAAYRAAAARAADWVAGSLRAPAGFQGGFIGEEPAQTRLTWVSTEHNLDLSVAFRLLGRAADAAHAARFVDAMWSRQEGRFLTGLTPAGTPNPYSGLDANVWPQLAAGMPPALRPALAWVLTRQALPAGSPRAEIRGLDFNDDRDGIWMEGTAFTALALTLTGAPADAALAARLLGTVAANTDASGLVFATDVPALTTGLTTGLNSSAPPFLYFRRPHLAPTAWAALAALAVNPFRV